MCVLKDRNELLKVAPPSLLMLLPLLARAAKSGANEGGTRLGV